MNMNWGRMRQLTGMLALLCLCTHSVEAGDKGKGNNKTTESSSDGGINPSNVAVTESDFEASSSPKEESTSTESSTYDANAGSSQEPTPSEPSTYDANAGYSQEPMSPEEQMHIYEAHQRATGSGVVIAVLDAGFDAAHPAIAANVVGGYDAIDGDSDPTDLGNGWDDDGDGIVDNGVGHGTFVTGMILRAAPDAMIVPIRVRNDEGWGSNDVTADGLEMAIRMGVDVINMSLSTGSGGFTRIRRLLAKAERQGIFVVVSAGNASSSELDALGKIKSTIVVGAVDATNTVATFSNVSNTTYWMVYAPGVDLLGPTTRGEYRYWSGTSFAAGFVTGGAALALEAHKNIALWELRQLLRDSIDPVKSADGGYIDSGLLNLAQVVR